MPGDIVCASDGLVQVQSRQVAVRARDHGARALPTWAGCRPLLAGEVFLLGDTPDSFDSRYWGPVPEANLVGPGFLALWPISTGHWGFIK